MANVHTWILNTHICLNSTKNIWFLIVAYVSYSSWSCNTRESHLSTFCTLSSCIWFTKIIGFMIQIEIGINQESQLNYRSKIKKYRVVVDNWLKLYERLGEPWMSQDKEEMHKWLGAQILFASFASLSFNKDVFVTIVFTFLCTSFYSRSLCFVTPAGK